MLEWIHKAGPAGLKTQRKRGLMVKQAEWAFLEYTCTESGIISDQPHLVPIQVRIKISDEIYTSPLGW